MRRESHDWTLVQISKRLEIHYTLQKNRYKISTFQHIFHQVGPPEIYSTGAWPGSGVWSWSTGCDNETGLDRLFFGVANNEDRTVPVFWGGPTMTPVRYRWTHLKIPPPKFSNVHGWWRQACRRQSCSTSRHTGLDTSRRCRLQVQGLDKSQCCHLPRCNVFSTAIRRQVFSFTDSIRCSIRRRSFIFLLRFTVFVTRTLWYISVRGLRA